MKIGLNSIEETKIQKQIERLNKTKKNENLNY